MRVLILDAIGALIDGNMVLRAYCNNPKCHHACCSTSKRFPQNSGVVMDACTMTLSPNSNAQHAGSRDVGLILSNKETEGRGHV
jgi:hypothetical protein